MHYYVLPEYPQLCKVSWDVSSQNYPELELIMRFVNRLSDKLSDRYEFIYIVMRGADCSEWKDLREFAERCPSNVYIDIEVGLAQKLSYWESFPAVYNVLLNWTPEVSWRKVLNICKTREKSCVNLFVDYSKIRLTKRFYSKLVKNKISAFGVAFSDVLYSEEQLKEIYSFNNKAGKSYPGGLIWENELQGPAALITNNVNKFFGWSCRAGSMRFHIADDCAVYGCASKVQHLGQLDELSEIELLDYPIVCPMQQCRNVLDLTVEKWSPKLPTWSTQELP